MTDPLAAITASTIATLAFQKFIESAAGELAKKFTADAIAKMDELRKKIWDKMQGRSPKLDEALVNLEKGDRAALETVTKNLDVVMDEEGEFATEIRLLAKEIQAGKIQDNSSMVQDVDGDNNMIVQAKAEQGGKQYIAERMYFGGAEKD
jgi:hypothetical protein